MGPQIIQNQERFDYDHKADLSLERFDKCSTQYEEERKRVRQRSVA